MTLTKEHIIKSIQNHLDLPKNRSAEVVESVLEIMKKTLENGENVRYFSTSGYAASPWRG